MGNPFDSLTPPLEPRDVFAEAHSVLPNAPTLSQMQVKIQSVLATLTSYLDVIEDEVRLSRTVSPVKMKMPKHLLAEFRTLVKQGEGLNSKHALELFQGKLLRKLNYSMSIKSLDASLCMQLKGLVSILTLEGEGVAIKVDSQKAKIVVASLQEFPSSPIKVANAALDALALRDSDDLQSSVASNALQPQ